MPYLGVKPAAITSATEAEIAGDLTVDTNTLHVDAANNRVGVGTVSPVLPLEVNGSTNVAVFRSDASNSIIQLANSTGTGGDNGTLVGSVGDHLYFRAGDSEKGRVLSSGGLTCNGDTATVNALDDYEEGTFTPQVYHSSTDNATFSAANGNYTKIGNTVTCQIRLDSGNTGTAGTFLVIDGLPFTVNQGQQNQTIGVWGSNPSAQVGNIHGFNPPRVFKGGSDVTTQMTFFTALLVYKI